MLLTQIAHDPSVKRWTGRWFHPKLHERYLVPENSANHPEHRGRMGVCIEVKVTGFGMSWALISFDEPRQDINDNDWIRTIHLIPVEDND